MKISYIFTVTTLSLIVGCSDSSDRPIPEENPTPSAANCPASTIPFPLVNQTQLDGEEKTEALFSSAPVQKQLQITLDRFLEHPIGGVRENEQDAPMYAEEQTRSISLHTATRDPYRPFILWGSWIGARTGLDNPDTVYRQVALTEEASYEIRGKRNLSSGIFFVLYDIWPGTDGGRGETIGFLDNDDLVVSEDGTFTVTLDAEPANGRDNHIQLVPGSYPGQHSLLIRDSLANWCQTPSELSVERLSPGPDELPPAPNDSELEMLTVNNLDMANLTWTGVADIFRSFTPNLFPFVLPTSGGLVGQYSAPGNFNLEAEHALVITIDPAGAPYQGFQLGSDYFASFDYENHTSSLSAGQAKENADGTITYVISLEDPGVWNWLDPVGHPQGLMFIRWQGLGDSPPPPVPVTEYVEISDLDSYLPEGMVRVTPEERSTQISERAARVALRRGE